MGKVISILGACVAVAGGAAFGLYTYTTVSCEHVDRSTCPIVQGGCCGGPTESNTSAGDETTPAVAVAGGPAALFATVPVKAEVSACCATKAVAKAACCEEKLTAGAACCETASRSLALQAVAGPAAVK